MLFGANHVMWQSTLPAVMWHVCFCFVTCRKSHSRTSKKKQVRHMFCYDLESNLMGLLYGVHWDIQIMWFVFCICRIQQELVKRHKCNCLRIIWWFWVSVSLCCGDMVKINCLFLSFVDKSERKTRIMSNLILSDLCVFWSGIYAWLWTWAFNFLTCVSILYL